MPSTDSTAAHGYISDFNIIHAREWTNFYQNFLDSYFVLGQAPPQARTLARLSVEKFRQCATPDNLLPLQVDHIASFGFGNTAREIFSVHVLKNIKQSDPVSAQKVVFKQCAMTGMIRAKQLDTASRGVWVSWDSYVRTLKDLSNHNLILQAENFCKTEFDDHKEAEKHVNSKIERLINSRRRLHKVIFWRMPREVRDNIWARIVSQGCQIGRFWPKAGETNHIEKIACIGGIMQREIYDTVFPAFEFCFSSPNELTRWIADMKSGLFFNRENSQNHSIANMRMTYRAINRVAIHFSLDDLFRVCVPGKILALALDIEPPPSDGNSRPQRFALTLHELSTICGDLKFKIYLDYDCQTNKIAHSSGRLCSYKLSRLVASALRECAKDFPNIEFQIVPSLKIEEAKKKLEDRLSFDPEYLPPYWHHASNYLRRTDLEKEEMVKRSGEALAFQEAERARKWSSVNDMSDDWMRPDICFEQLNKQGPDALLSLVCDCPMFKMCEFVGSRNADAIGWLRLEDSFW